MTKEIAKFKNNPETIAIIKKANYDNLPAKDLYGAEISIRKMSLAIGINGEICAKAVLLRMLMKLNQYAYGNNTDKYMSEEQAADIANTLFRSFGDFNIKEINYIFQGIKTGEYGKLYGSYSGNFIMEAFRAYRVKRARFIAKHEQKDYFKKVEAMQKIDGAKELSKYLEKKLLRDKK